MLSHVKRVTWDRGQHSVIARVAVLPPSICMQITRDQWKVSPLNKKCFIMQWNQKTDWFDPSKVLLQ